MMETPILLCTCKHNYVVYFCASHKDVICPQCTKVEHTKCDTLTIEEALENETVVNEFKASSDQINQLCEQAISEDNNQSELLQELSESEQLCKGEIERFKKDISTMLDTLEEKTLNELKDHVSKQESIINVRKELCGNIIKNLQHYNQTSEQIQEKKDKKQTFVEKVKHAKKLHVYETAINDIHKESYAPSIDFTEDQCLEEIQNQVEKLGSLYSLTKHCQVTLNVTQEETAEVKKCLLDVAAKRVKEFSVTPMYDAAPDYSAAVFMENGDILLCDQRNSKLILLGTSQEIKDTTETLGEPWDLTGVDNKQVIYSMGSCQGLQYVQVYPRLELGHRIPLGRLSFGVKFSRGNIYVSSFNSVTGEILVLDKYGELQNTVKLCHGKYNFRCAYYLEINDKGDRLYIAEWSDHTVACFKTDGTVMFVYSHMDLYSPRSLVVDGNDNVLVGIPGSFKIHVIKSDGTHHKTLHLGESAKGLRSIAYNFKDDTMLVCCYEQKEMFLYQIK